MPAVDYRNMAGDILQYVGGESNIVDATNCSTRLRLKLRDDSLADKAAIEKLPGVMTVVQAGGQFQIVIGDNVSMVLDALSNRMNLTDAAPEKKGSKENIFNRFIDLISAIFSPVIWLIAAAGLLKAFMSLFVQLGWMDGAGQTYLILNAAGDSTFYFLPVLLGLTSARKFGANQFTAMAIGGRWSTRQ